MSLPYCSFAELHVCIILFPLDSCLFRDKPNTAQRKAPGEAVTQITFAHSLVFGLIQPQVRKEAQWLLVCEISSQSSSAARWEVCKTSAVEL